MQTKKLTSIGVAILLLLHGSASGQSIEGSYAAKGSGPKGTAPYAGTVAIKQDGPICTLAWQLTGNKPYTGTGIVVGEVLAAGYGGDKPYGLVVYKVSGGKLSGRWIIGGTKNVGEETLSGPEGLSGTYQITSGKDATAKAYTGTVTITKNGDAYALNWTLPNESYSGVGILHGGLLVASWGKGQGHGAVVYDLKGSTLSGPWTAVGMTALGTETLTK